MGMRSLCSALCRALRLAAPLLIAFGVGAAEDSPTSYKEAEAIWQKTRDVLKYQEYVAEFAALNNAFRIDERDGCYSLAPGPVNLMLLVSPADAKGVATIERVFYDTDNAKARCFERSYRGLPAKAPPFLPLVLQLRME
jgi:hypothetical protein